MAKKTGKDVAEEAEVEATIEEDTAEPVIENVAPVPPKEVPAKSEYYQNLFEGGN